MHTHDFFCIAFGHVLLFSGKRKQTGAKWVQCNMHQDTATLCTATCAEPQAELSNFTLKQSVIEVFPDFRAIYSKYHFN